MIFSDFSVRIYLFFRVFFFSSKFILRKNNYSLFLFCCLRNLSYLFFFCVFVGCFFFLSFFDFFGLSHIITQGKIDQSEWILVCSCWRKINGLRHATSSGTLTPWYILSLACLHLNRFILSPCHAQATMPPSALMDITVKSLLPKDLKHKLFSFEVSCKNSLFWGT